MPEQLKELSKGAINKALMLIKEGLSENYDVWINKMFKAIRCLERLYEQRPGFIKITKARETSSVQAGFNKGSMFGACFRALSRW